MRRAKMTHVDRGRTIITIAVISLCVLIALDSAGVRKASAAPGGNAACAHFCADLFGDTPAAGTCTSEAAHDTGTCYECGPASDGSLQLCGTQCCTALDQCHVPGTCDPNTEACSNPLVPTGTSCNDNNPLCVNGACCGAGSQVVNGACFLIGNAGCPSGCQGVGSVIGSGNFLCATVDNNYLCTSNQDCPVGEACARPNGSILGHCLIPCN